ncbi:MAG TPA: branched-chain amino acid transaminase [Candidatus Binatia bacterium]|nr:branched-chain amino acid transaminase [Candidatus Binatia bacterium]
MLTQKTARTTAKAAEQARAPRELDDLITYFQGGYVPMRDARVSVMTHAFMYGTATFEGIRAYWNADQQRLYGLFIREHAERFRHSAHILLMEDLPSVDELVAIILETARRNHFREDCYIRPSFYKSTRAIGVKLHHLDHDLTVISVPFGDYVETARGIRIMTSSWRRNADEALPARGKITGGYVNMAFQKSEAELNGFDEALVLTPDGHASEASAANLFVVRDGVLITPPVSDDILEGVTRKAILRLATDAGIPTEVRSIDRSELYIADEVLICGTGVQVSPVVEVDHRAIGTGAVGPIGLDLRDRYFDAVRGRTPRYLDWLTPIDEGG